MSEANIQNSGANSNQTAGHAGPKKGRLGRGLGSLLGGAAESGSNHASGASLEDPGPAAFSSPISALAQPASTASSAVPSSPAQMTRAVIISRPGETAPAALQERAPEKTSSVALPIEPIKIPDESQIWQISVERLRPNTQQPRKTFSPEALKDLAASIREQGIMQPIVARRIDERSYEIIAGERRWRAAQAAGLHEVPVILRKSSDQSSLELAIIENIQRENFNPLEEGEAYDRLMNDYHLTQQQVSEKVGKERATVANSLRLLSLPKEVKDMLRRSELSAGHAKAILAIDSPLEQISIAQQVLEEKLSVRATEKLVAKAKAGATSGSDVVAPTQRQELSKKLATELGSELQKLLGTKVEIDYASGKGKVQVHFYSDEELNSFAEKIRKACRN